MTNRRSTGASLGHSWPRLACAFVALTAVGCFLDATAEGTPGGGAAGGGGVGGDGVGGDGASQPVGGQPSEGGAGGSPSTDGGGGAGPVAVCGDGAIGGAEECDDQNVVPGDGCDDSCAVECGGVEDPDTHHCYVLVSGSNSWGECVDTCNGAGTYLASLARESEFQVVAGLLEAAGWPGDVWVGGFQVGTGVYEWVSGEPWGWSPKGFSGWKGGEPTDDDGNDEDHIAIWNPTSDLKWLADASEGEDKSCLCERNPAGS